MYMETAVQRSSYVDISNKITTNRLNKQSENTRRLKRTMQVQDRLCCCFFTTAGVHVYKIELIFYNIALHRDLLG